MNAALTTTDLLALESRWITPELADAAGLFRVRSVDGAALVGRNGTGDWSGLAIPNVVPGQTHAREYRLRVDHPELEQASDGSVRAKNKYLAPPGRSNLLYFVPGTAVEQLEDANLPVAVVEGEFKTLALSRLAFHDTDSARWLAVGILGCWSWRGSVGKTAGPDGDRRDVHGVIGDFDRITWDGRPAYLVADANMTTNTSVAAAWRELGRELHRRGARCATVTIPAGSGINGIDDYLAQHGPEAALALFAAAKTRSTARDYHCTDAGNAERLVNRHGDDLRFVGEWGWLAWDGCRWRKDDVGEVDRRALDTVRSILSDAADLEDKEQRKQLAGFALRSESRGSIANMIIVAESQAAIRSRSEVFDLDPWLLNVVNGTLDLRKGELRPHSRADLITRVAPVVWDSTAECPRFRSFLTEVFDSTPGIIRFLQKLVGYSLTGITSEQILAILWGGGSNGKSTLVEVLAGLLGEYGAKTPVSTLLASKQDNIPNDLAALQGVRFAYASEVDEGRRLAESLLKDVTGGERIRARFLRREWFEFTPEFKLWLSTNHKPVIRGTDLAVWRRIRLVPFNQTFAPEQQDRMLAAKLKAELSGILRWAVEGCLAWQAEGLEPPKEVKAATDGYRVEMDTLATFLTECTEADTVGGASAKALYKAYVAWSEANGERAVAQKVLGSKLRDRGFDSTHRRDGDYWLGIRLLDEVPFGKYEGRHLQDVPTSYLDWLTTIALRPFLRRAVAAELAARGFDQEQDRDCQPAVAVAVAVEPRAPGPRRQRRCVATKLAAGPCSVCGVGCYDEVHVYEPDSGVVGLYCPACCPACSVKNDRGSDYAAKENGAKAMESMGWGRAEGIFRNASGETVATFFAYRDVPR